MCQVTKDKKTEVNITLFSIDYRQDYSGTMPRAYSLKHFTLI